MVLDLNKGQEFNLDLTKETKFEIALQWGYNRTGVDMDLDVSAFLLNESAGKNKLLDMGNAVYFKNKESKDKSVRLSGDSRDGAAEKDDEVIYVDTSKIASDVSRIQIYVNIFAPKVSFREVQTALAIVRTGNTVLATVNMSTDFQNENSILVGFISKVNGNWTFTAGGEGYIITDLNTIVAALNKEGV
jgi:stress response protein SCP2